MKATFFYSAEQSKAMRSIEPSKRYTYVYGKEYTEYQVSEGVHKSNWPDARIVHIEKDLPVCEFTFQHDGSKIAKTPDGMITLRDSQKINIDKLAVTRLGKRRKIK